MAEYAPQLVLIHLSDLHFGNAHRFDPPPTPHGDRPKRIGYPTLLEKLREDWKTAIVKCPVIVCITGDLTTTASDNEFEEAASFIAGLDGETIFGVRITRREVFVVPGNHDVLYEGPSEVDRMKSWGGLL